MKKIITLGLVLSVVLTGCTVQSEGTATTETTNVAATSPPSSPTPTPTEVRCVDDHPPTDVNPEHLLPQSGDGWTRLADTGYSVNFMDGYEVQAYAQYEGPDRAAYDVSVTRWKSADAAAEAFEDTTYVAATSGSVGVVVSGPDPAAAREMLLRVPCIESGDVVEESSFSLETMTPQREETDTTSTVSG